MDPSGKATSAIKPPQPFEIALVRKLESKSSSASVREAFLLLDADGDGRITAPDVRTILHNELGLDITKEQMECLFERSQQSKDAHNNNNGNGMGYAQFAKYFQEVSSATFQASQSGLAAAVGFHRDSNGDGDHEISIHLQPQTILHRRRKQLRELLRSHSSRESHGKSGMKDTSLFLAIDVHRSGKVTMQEFLDWLNAVGMLQWSIEDLKRVVLVTDDKREREKLEKHWFVSEGGKEAGMTEHEFAEFVELLDCQ
ncbi:hypothetical protein ACHAWF_007404 [Thalassiosira exigua]